MYRNTFLSVRSSIPTTTAIAIMVIDIATNTEIVVVAVGGGPRGAQGGANDAASVAQGDVGVRVRSTSLI